jgi:uncharacterized membrane protein YkvA (DUF1232 family)
MPVRGKADRPTLRERLSQSARQLNTQTYILYFAYCDPRTPWYAKAWAALVVAYVISPIDLIPDFIPVIGYLDDLLLVPAGIVLALKMIPAEVMKEAREKAQQAAGPGRGVGWAGTAIIVLVWLIVLAGVGILVMCLIRR